MGKIRLAKPRQWREDKIQKPAQTLTFSSEGLNNF